MSEAETVVRMGQLAVASGHGAVLTSLGLGSCIGLALLDAGASVAGLAHIMLPQSAPGRGEPERFADTAVPLLLEGVLRAGARRHALRVVMVGGAQMFGFAAGGGLDVGVRNEEATRAALSGERLAVSHAVTGGSVGRTIRVHVGACSVTVKEAGGPEVQVWGSAAA